ncbi:MAG: S41 family peptidase [Gemmatimonadaceae bacterium]|nr:S41 family peptidase [Gemmatimonadaceae bacterium]
MAEELPDTPRPTRRRSRAVLAVGLFVGLLSLGGWWAGHDLAPAAAPPRRANGGARLFDQVLGAVATRYVDSLDAATIYDKAVTGLLRELKDPYTTFLGEGRLRRLNEQMSGTYTGVGLQIDVRDGWPTVIEPVPGGPSWKAGIIAGDRLVKVAGEVTKGWTRDEASKALRGPPGSKVNFEIGRADQRLTITVQRSAVHLAAVTRVTMLPNAVGYVDVNVFNQSTSAELQVAVDSLVRLGARSLVMDLRGNPGGLLEQGVGVAELFLDPRQSIVELRARPGQAPQIISDTAPQRWPTLPLAVLIDKGSASSSEIVAGALQDHDRAVIVGMTSYGKGSAQNVYPLASGGALRLTTARWFTPVGRSISKPRPRDPDDDDAESNGVALPSDTLRPRFRTDDGRTVLGGGGITPDVQVGDSITPIPVQILARAMGKRLADYRDALAKEATALKPRMKSPNDPVTREMLDAVYQSLVTHQVAPDRSIFDNASPWVARSLGYEMTRVAFGPDAEFLRRAQDDPAIQRSMQILQAARQPRQVFTSVTAVAPR